MLHMGKNFEDILRTRGMTKYAFAKEIKRSRQWVNEICHSRSWRISTIMRVSKGLGVKPSDLLPQEQ